MRIALLNRSGDIVEGGLAGNADSHAIDGRARGVVVCRDGIGIHAASNRAGRRRDARILSVRKPHGVRKARPVLGGSADAFLAVAIPGPSGVERIECSIKAGDIAAYDTSRRLGANGKVNVGTAHGELGQTKSR